VLPSFHGGSAPPVGPLAIVATLMRSETLLTSELSTFIVPALFVLLQIPKQAPEPTTGSSRADTMVDADGSVTYIFVDAGGLNTKTPPVVMKVTLVPLSATLDEPIVCTGVAPE
jgi:hypothetical protein